MKYLKSLMMAAVLVCPAAVAPAAASDQAGEAATVESARDTVARWVETQKILARERGEWAVGKEVLQERVELLEGEIASLEEKITQARSAGGETGEQNADLAAGRRALKAATESAGASIGDLEDKIRRLITAIPEPIRERVAPLSGRLPRPGGETTLSLGERFQNVVGILNEVNKFNQDITVTTEVRTLADGSAVEVKALYLGLGQGYYVTINGDHAGVGRPTPEGWQWVAADP